MQFLVLLQVSVVTDSESATEYADSSQVRIREFFAAVSDCFGSSVRESIFTYQVIDTSGMIL